MKDKLGQNKDRMEVLVLSRAGRGRAVPHLGHKEHNQSNVGREHNGQRGKGKGCILLAGKNHGDRSSDETQDLERQHLGDSDIMQGFLPPLQESP